MHALSAAAAFLRSLRGFKVAVGLASRVLAAVVLPQTYDQFSCGDGVRVERDELEDEGSVLLQVLLDELRAGLALLGVGQRPPVVLNVLADVPHPVAGHQEPENPLDEREAGHRGDGHHPEPEEEVDLLVELVNWQDALDRVAMEVPEPPDVEVAERDAREPG